MSKIRNDFIKQHQRERWRYRSLLAQSVDARFPAPTMAHASQRVPNFTKNTSKTHRTLIPRTRVRKRAPLDGARFLACA